MSETAAPYVTVSTNADPAPADGRYPVPWLCQVRTGHVVGQVVKKNGIARLELFGIATSEYYYNRHPDQSAAILATLTGTAEVKCSICGATRTWFAAEEGLRELEERRAKREAEKF